MRLTDQRIQPFTDPTNRKILLWQLGTQALAIGPREDLLRLLKPDPALRVRPQLLALMRIKLKSHTDSITVIPKTRRSSTEPASSPPRLYTPPMAITLDAATEERIQRQLDRGTFHGPTELLAHVLGLLEK